MADPGAPFLHFEQVSKTHDAPDAIDGVTLAIAAGEVTALVGASGSGKSTRWMEMMRQANLMVDRDEDKQTPGKAAAWLLEQIR